jgi:hypothetical protein
MHSYIRLNIKVFSPAANKLTAAAKLAANDPNHVLPV